MMHYHLSSPNPDTHFIQVVWTIPQLHQDILHIQLPAWRPGRYELQHYAKNIRDFNVADENGNTVSYRKTGRDSWEINVHGLHQVVVTYDYYANQLDAGASYVCEDFMYVNPVNMLMYAVGRMDEPGEIVLDIPQNRQVATQLEQAGEFRFLSPDFDYLADSPFIASADLEHHVFALDQCNLHCWFQGSHHIDRARLQSDTMRYAALQKQIFGDLPCIDYHFLYLMLDKPFRHGVEHLNSTVIAMGMMPDSLNEEFYQDLLAISSHEFFHLWNVKRIRPADMMPYDFTRENYSTLGYVYEGVTTYYGDLILLRSGVWSLEQYLNSLESDLKRHYDNEGRFHYSVAESSWDTWLDGYVPGVPGRKVSIYIEGLIAAFCADTILLKNSRGKYRLDDVMRELYTHDYKEGRGYTEARYRELLERYGNCSFEAYFEELIWGRGNHDKWLRNCMDSIGFSIEISEAGNGKRIRVILSDESGLEKTELFEQWMGRK